MAANGIHWRHIEILLSAATFRVAAAFPQRVSFCTTGSTDAFSKPFLSVKNTR